MPVHDYTFLDRWRIPHPIHQVWLRIVDATAYPGWWGEVYERVTPLLKPLFAWNHRWTMQRGEAALMRLFSKEP